MNPDQINATFMVVAICMILPSVVRAYRRKRIEGVHPITPTWFVLWSAWNVYYFIGLGQRWSGLIGMVSFIVDAAWLALVIIYSPKDHGCANQA